MTRTVIAVEGMVCGMCEAHVNDAVRKAFDVKKVKSSRRKRRCEIVSEAEIDVGKLKRVIIEAGYEPGEISH